MSYILARRAMRGNRLLPAVSRMRAEARPGVRAVQRGDERAAGVHLASAVQRTLTLLPTDSRCLVRALVLTAMLSRRGIACSLVIGVHSGPGFGAHAWIELEGEPILPAGGPGTERLIEVDAAS